MLHFPSAQLSQTRVMSDGDGNTWIVRSQTPGWHKWLFYLFSVEAVYSPRDTSHCRLTRDDSDSRLACDHEMSQCLVVRVCRWWQLCSALFMRLTPDNLLTSWSGSDLSDIRESELNFLGLLIPGPLPTHIMGKINWNKSSLDYNGSNDKWATQ